MNDRVVRSLASMADITVGHVGQMTAEYREDGVAFLRSQNVAPFRLDLADVKYVSYDFHRRLGKSVLVPGDVVVVRTGSPGTAAVVPESLSVANCSDLVIVRPGPELDARYLCYFMNSAARAFVQSRLVGAVQQHFNVRDARELRIPLPSLQYQKRVAGLLVALDDKIDASGRLARLSDELWLAFAEHAMDQAAQTAVSTQLTNLAAFVNGRAFTKAATGTGRMVIRIAELNSGPGRSTVYNDIDVPEQHLARPGDLLFAWSGSLTVQRWFRDEAIVNQHIFKVVPEDGVPVWLVHAHLLHLLDGFRGIAADKATTMGHIQRRHLEVSVPRLDASALAEADAKCDPLWRRALAAEREMLALSALRDALLPPLMSGELHVRGAEDLIGENT